jgi:hypothetical protein
VHVWTEFKPFELTLNEEQIPQMIENNKNQGCEMDSLEGLFLRPRQVRYQAALRPDSLQAFINSTLPAL